MFDSKTEVCVLLNVMKKKHRRSVNKLPPTTAGFWHVKFSERTEHSVVENKATLLSGNHVERKEL